MIINDHNCKFIDYVEGEYTIPAFRIFECKGCKDRFAVFYDGGIIEHDRNMTGKSCDERKKLKMIKDIIE